MSETTSTVVVGDRVLVVGGSAGTLIEPALADADAVALGDALGRPGVGTEAAEFADALSEATGRIETAQRRFAAVADGSIGIWEASDLMDGLIGLLEQLDREGDHKEALELARAMNGLLALAKRWADLYESLGIALAAARKIGSEAGKAGEAWAQHEFGTLHTVAGDADEADRRLSEARRLRRELGDRAGLAATEQNLGALCRRVAGDGRPEGQRSRRILAAGAALLLLLGGGVVLASQDDDPPDAASIGEIARLTVETEGPGTVTSRPAGIDCPDRCDADLAAGTEIELTPDPDDGATFASWSGVCASAGTDPCTVRPRRDRTVIATFREEDAPQPEMVTLAVDPPNDGRVVSRPEGIDCGDDCSHEFEVGDSVELVATADPGFQFTAWGNACPGDNPCELTMGTDRTVSATFTAERTITVTVTGEGTVRSDPAGITCTAGPCADTFLADAGPVVLTASDGTFLEWGGDCAQAGEATTCTLELDANHEATAAFEPPAEP